MLISSTVRRRVGAGWIGCMLAMATTSALTACSGSVHRSAAPAKSAPGSSGATALNDKARADYCTVFSSAELAKVFGQPVHVGDVTNQYGDGCLWNTADGKGQLVILRQLPGQYNDMIDDADHPIPGLGDKAFFGPSQTGGVFAGAVANNTFYTLTINPAPADDDVVQLLREFMTRHR